MSDSFIVLGGCGCLHTYTSIQLTFRDHLQPTRCPSYFSVMFQRIQSPCNLRWTEASRVCVEAGRWPGKISSNGARQPCLESDARNAVLPPWGERSRLIRPNQDAKRSIGRSHELCPHRLLHQTEPARIAHNLPCIGRQPGRRMSCLSDPASFKRLTIMVRRGSRSANQVTPTPQRKEPIGPEPDAERSHVR
jgi:hypothetical protein